MAGFIIAIWLVKKFKPKHRVQKNKHGSSDWANDKEMKQAGLFNNGSVILGKLDKLICEKILSYSDNAHVAVIAPTRSGKGVGLVVPTLLSWPGSVLCVDLKGENWDITAGYRSRFSNCYRFSPTMQQSNRFNLLDCIRQDDLKVGDAQMVASAIGGLDSSALEDTYWNDSSIMFLTIFIVYTLEHHSRKSLAGVIEAINDQNLSITEILNDMLRSHHSALRIAARSLLNMNENQLLSIVGAALRHLALYYDPIVAKNTDKSDFSIESIMQGDKPTSVYLSIPPPDIERTRSLFRLVISLITKRLTETIHNPNNKYPLLILFDEFTAFGKIDFFETALSYVAGYGIKAMMIAQSMNQVYSVYGARTSVIDQCECKVFLTPNDITTARIISDMLGKKTIEEKRRSYSKNNESFSESSFGRPLMHPDEIMTMPSDDALIFVKGHKPVKCKRLKYYEDDYFKNLVNIRTPSLYKVDLAKRDKQIERKVKLKPKPVEI